MKMGFRTPSPKRSFSARTTGKVHRTIKKATNPLYGKKGMGYINNPQKAVYNKIYNKTTVSAVNHSKTSHTYNELSSLTVVELKDILRVNGLKVSGTKAELINRIMENSTQPITTSTKTDTNVVTDTDKAAGTLTGCAVGIYCCPLLIIGILLFALEMYAIALIFFAIYALIIFAAYSMGKN